MDSKNVEIRIIDSWIADDIIALYKAGGWWKGPVDSVRVQRLITGSCAFVVAVDTVSQKAIGMGRLLSDGVSDAYIQDVIVLPRYRGQGIGKRLIIALLEFCHSHGIQWVGLIAEPGYEAFYKHMGFTHMKAYVPMLLDQGEH
jgi:GNAT superfamily N-acetyltransferase